MRRLEGRTAVIVGGASGFGLATAERFAAEGAHVVVLGRRGELAAETGARLGGSGGPVDVTDRASVIAATERVVAERGGVDVAVNYAGYERSTPIRDLTPEILGPMIEVQLTGAIWFLQQMAGAMAASGGGSVINISSFTAHAPSVGQAAYAGAKAGLEYVTEIAALEYGPDGVRINAIAPHLIETPMTERFFQMPLVVEAITRQTPLRRMGTVGDVAACCAYLASDDAAFVTGQTIRVDGGGSTQKLPTADDYQLLAAAHPELVAAPSGASAPPDASASTEPRARADAATSPAGTTAGHHPEEPT